jgi:predicted RNA binding protein YcfA (HicA-like mRNA interferase family)
MCRILESRGWRYVRSRGSHRLYRHGDSPELINVPIHGGDLKPGTQRDIMKKAGLTEADL